MDDKCIFCGKQYDENPIYHDWPFNHLNTEGMFCWECYHKELVRRGIAGFNLSFIGNNSGTIDNLPLANAILAAIDEIEYEDNMDMAIGIDADIGGSYTSSLVVRNHSLYIRVADLFPLAESKSDAEKLELIGKIIDQLTWNVQRPMPKETTDNT